MLTQTQLGVHLNEYDNSWYCPASRVKICLWLITNALFFNHGLAVFNGFKCFLLKLFGAKIGKGVLIKPSVNIKYPWFLSIGDHCWIGENVWIDNLTHVSIGNNVCISQGAMLLTGNHDFTKSTFDLIVKPIVIEDGVWIGAKSVVCPGVYCESHAVLSVQSVATQRLSTYAIYKGNPAQPIKSREVNLNDIKVKVITK
jgi:putative colanic acid biosynthesis acetyltransferase WcaF